MRISDWSSDVCSSDLPNRVTPECLKGGKLLCPDPFDQAQVRLGTAEQDLENVGCLDHLLRRDDLGRMGIDSHGARGIERGFQTRADQTETRTRLQNGRASCRERVCKYVSISVGAVSLK